ncbi:ubiquitin-conjugating enzyme E2 S-like protein [Pavlovales sp. CCMP2436]|nr:ubiquitin-conjugating enzyme E2 S-like protein [Pavlovales sp. CCMP2436]|mmetsp:Transcript_26056/g.66169  ORF Transcript_26056/g.66169 Transcript_26056/m.66169 type:complete len:203 (-) Transcript_26056:116-724(-)
MGENIAPAVVMRVAKELRALQLTPPDGIKVHLNEESITDIRIDINGPIGTPFEGGMWSVKLVLPPDFPASPPKGYFLTKIFHPNISKAGEICVNTLKRDWKEDISLGHIMQVIRCLLINPFPESALNEDAAKLFMEEYSEYAKQARLMCDIHARPKLVVRLNGNAQADGSSSTDGGMQKKARGDAALIDKKKLEKKKSLKRL